MRLEVGDHQVAANRIGVDGAVQMPSEVEIISNAESVTVAEVLFQRDVRLLRIRVDEVLRLRVAEGLEAERQGCGRVQIVLVEKDRLGKVLSLKLLLVGEESKGAGCAWVQTLPRTDWLDSAALIGSP